MVQHNSKWDKKATRKYYQKHGIIPPGKNVQQKEPNSLQSNIWRFQTTVNDEAHDDQQLNELLNDDPQTQKNEDNEDEKEQTSSEFTIADVLAKKEQAKEEVSLYPKQEQEDDDDDLQAYLELTRSKTVASKKEYKGNVVVDSSSRNFYEIQHQIDRSKMKSDIQQRFKRKSKKDLNNNNNINNDTQEAAEIDDFLDELDNLDVGDDNKTKPPVTTKKFNTTSLQNQDFLDDLLNK